MFKLFIKRPILSGVISVIIVCLGVLSILTLPITQFPDYTILYNILWKNLRPVL